MMNLNLTSGVECPKCKHNFAISDAISSQINEQLNKEKDRQFLTLKSEFDLKEQESVKNAIKQAKDEAELSFEKERSAAKFELEKARQAIELDTERLRLENDAAKESEKELRKQLTKLLEELRLANKAKDDAELAAQKKLVEMAKGIREEENQRASEDYNLKIREQEEVINKLREQLTTAKQVAEQGSQQLQGEILELDVEAGLRNNFPYDTISEVKKGERGSDIRQLINEPFHQNCGLILWECKNAKNYQTSWLGKLKDEIVAEKAQVGVLVFDGGSDAFEQLADNIWMVKPRFAVLLAGLLRDACIKIDMAKRNAQGKDVKSELLYSYLTGGEFSNRIRAIVEAYDEMTKQLDTEKKQSQKRWAAQEKILQKVTSNLYGLGGDLQGITGADMVALPIIDDEVE